MVVITDCQPEAKGSLPAYSFSYTLKQLCQHHYRTKLYEKLGTIKIEAQISRNAGDASELSLGKTGGDGHQSVEDDLRGSDLLRETEDIPPGSNRSFCDLSLADENVRKNTDVKFKAISELADLAEYLNNTDKEDAIRELGDEDAYEFCVDCVWSAKHNTAQARHIVDRIHGHINFPKLFWQAIIDCLIVQRQRTLSQVGGMFYIFPTATHTRFEHALGVAYLSCHWLDTLALRIGDLSRSRNMCRLRMAVLLAGICHDVGHGPYSHSFEAYARTLPGFSNWKHERMSIRMFKVMAKTKRVKALMSDFGVTIEDVTRRISGIWPSDSVEQFSPKSDNSANRRALTAEERLEIGSRYLINNRLSGIDADRLDYLVRDQKIAPRDLPGEVRSSRIIDHSAIGRDGRIVYNIKALDNIIEMFDVRYSMYNNIYRHRSNMIFECMHRDLIRFIDPLYDIKSCLVNFHKYVNLNEHLLSPWALEYNINRLISNGGNVHFGTNRYNKTMMLIKRLKYRRPYAQLVRVSINNTPADSRYYDMMTSGAGVLAYRPAQYKHIRVNAKNIHVCRTDLRPTSSGSPFQHIQFFSSGVDEHALLSPEQRKTYDGRWTSRFVDIYTSKLTPDLSKVVFACLYNARRLAETDSVAEWIPAEVENFDTDDESSFQGDLFSDEDDFESPSEASWASESEVELEEHEEDEGDNYITPVAHASQPGMTTPRNDDEYATPKSKSRHSQPPYWNNRFR